MSNEAKKLEEPDDSASEPVRVPLKARVFNFNLIFSLLFSVAFPVIAFNQPSLTLFDGLYLAAFVFGGIFLFKEYLDDLKKHSNAYEVGILVPISSPIASPSDLFKVIGKGLFYLVVYTVWICLMGLIAWGIYAVLGDLMRLSWFTILVLAFVFVALVRAIKRH